MKTTAVARKQELEQAANEGKRELLEEMLTFADDLDLAISNLNETNSGAAEWAQMMHRRLLAVLDARGVVGIESVGQPFDPERHEAFDVRAGTDDKPGYVHSELRRGDFWNGKLLRPAMVVVAQ